MFPNAVVLYMEMGMGEMYLGLSDPLELPEFWLGWRYRAMNELNTASLYRPRPDGRPPGSSARRVSR